jgi:hypothetical protein
MRAQGARRLMHGGTLAALVLLVHACGSDDSNAANPGDAGAGPDATDATMGGDANDASNGGDTSSDQSVHPDSPKGGDTPPTTFTAGSVLQHHLHPSRDGLYTDPLFTKAKAAMLTRDTAFAGMISGAVLGQPLYGSDVTPGKDAVFVATEGNDVYSLDGKTGAQNWMKNLGPTVALSALPCGGGIDPYGVTGTPIIDPASRTMYLESISTPDSGMTEEHRVYALSVDDGSVKAGWPVKIDGTTVPGFDPHVQHDRGALALLNGILYVPFTGLNGDCGTYHGWIDGIDTTKPTTIKSWATGAAGGGAWGTAGVASTI